MDMEACPCHANPKLGRKVETEIQTSPLSRFHLHRLSDTFTMPPNQKLTPTK